MLKMYRKDHFSLYTWIDLYCSTVEDFSSSPLSDNSANFVLRQQRVLQIRSKLCRDEKGWSLYLTPQGQACRRYFKACICG